jgi:hypothetical protein
MVSYDERWEVMSKQLTIALSKVAKRGVYDE